MTKILDVGVVVEMFMRLGEISRGRVMLYHTEVFVQKGKVGLYCLGGVDEKVGGLYGAPEEGETGEEGYVWNLGVLFYYVLFNEEIEGSGDREMGY